LSRKCGNLDVSNPHGPSWPVAGISDGGDGLFYYAIINSDHTPMNGRIIDELERVWKEAFVA
jgi:hypothetical protein